MSSAMQSRRLTGYRAGFSLALLFLGSGAYALWQTLGDRLIDDGWSPRLAHVSASNAGRRILTQELIEGHLTFPEAIERFRTLSSHNPYFSWTVFNQAFPGTSDAECFGRQVIAFVRCELTNAPDQAQALIGGLEPQLYSSATQSYPPAVQ